MSLNTPVLFLIFNRPDTTATVFERIRQAKPKQLFVAADGPRPTRTGEKEKCEAARQIATNIDWDCEVKTLFRDENKGCGIGVSEAITWFFEHVGQGIILEDDVLPADSFFRFCEELLERYKDDDRVKCIGANNLISDSFVMKESYLFSMYCGIWGWATWRRAWQGYDYTIASWADKENKYKLKNKMSGGQYLFFEHLFNQVSPDKTKFNAWSYQFIYKRLIEDGVAIVPPVNLTKNIGINEDATHTSTAIDEVRHMVLSEISFPLVHPSEVALNKRFDKQLSKKYAWITKNIIKRVINKIGRKIGIGTNYS